MSKRAEASFSVEGRRFHLAVSAGESSVSLDCGAEEGDSPVATAVATAWLSNPEALLRSVKGRTGLSFEGEVAFGYGGDESEPRPGVTAFVFDKEETVTEAFFARFVAEFGLTCLDASAKLGIATGEPLRTQLLELRQRPG